MFFSADPVLDYGAAEAADHGAYARFFHAMLERGVALPPSGYEAWFLGTAHGEPEIERTLEAVREAAAATAPSR